MRNMIEHLRDSCDQFNIGVISEVYDGQFLNLIQRGEFGQPLTKLQLLKDIYNDCKKLSKEALITFLVHYSREHPEHLSNIITPRNKLELYICSMYWNRNYQEIQDHIAILQIWEHYKMTT